MSGVWPGWWGQSRREHSSSRGLARTLSTKRYRSPAAALVLLKTTCSRAWERLRMSPPLSPGQCRVSVPPAPVRVVPQEVMPGFGPALARMLPSPPPPPPAPVSVPVAWTWLSFPPLDFLSEIPEVSTPPVTPCTPFSEIQLKKIRSVPLCSVPASLLFARGAGSLAAPPPLSQPLCGSECAGPGGELVSPLQKGIFLQAGFASTGVWVRLHPLLDDGALLTPVGLSEGRLLCTPAADRRHKFPAPAVTPPVRIIVSSSPPTQKRCRNSRALVHLYCTTNIAGSVAGRAAAAATSLADSQHPDHHRRGDHRPPRGSHLHP